MTFRVRSESRRNGIGLDPTVWLLDDGQGAGIEIWPALGFNCYRWHVAGREMLYADAHMFEENKPTRSGFPVLFPFPNRIRAGRFTWEGKEYRLPLNDSTAKNAIHGFACRHAWRVVDQGVDDASAWLTGEYHAARDAPETLSLWPTDHRIRITYRLRTTGLSVEAAVDNPDGRALPFGLGYHPYFAFPDAELHVPASAYWELDENLPTGRILPVDERRDLRKSRRLAISVLDDVLTGLSPTPPSLVGPLRLSAAADFREMVVFTPPHRQAVCLEPYTCTTDAINLPDAGWRTLAPGATWQAALQLDV